MLLLLGVEGSAPVSNSRCYLLTNEAETIASPDSSLGEVRTALLRLLSIWLVCQRVDTVTDYFSQSVARLIIASADGKPTDAIIVSLEHKDDYSAMINDEIDMLRHSATSALFERRDVIIVASVSCIYSLGDPKEYEELVVAVRPGMIMERDEFIRRLVAISYDRNDMSLERDKFRVYQSRCLHLQRSRYGSG